jgi:hypothetical protein
MTSRCVLAGFVSIVVCAIALVASFPLQLWNVSLAELRAKYQRAESKFATLDGVELHYQKDLARFQA